MQVFRNDVKTGLFILLAMVAFIYAIFRVGDLFDGFGEQREIQMIFTDALQVNEGTEVFYRGMKIGKVTSVGMNAEGEAVLVTARIDPESKLFQGTIARIDDKSMLGGKMIQLLAPTEGPRTAMPEDQVITSVPPADLTSMIATMNEILPELKDMVGSLVNKLTETLTEVDQTLAVLQDGLGKIDTLTPTMVETMESYKALAETAEGRIDEISEKLATTLDQAPGMLDSVENDWKVLTEDLKKQLSETTTQLNGLIASADKMVGGIDGMMTENREGLKTTLSALETTMVNLEELSATLAEKPNALIFGKSRKQKQRDKDKDNGGP